MKKFIPTLISASVLSLAAPCLFAETTPTPTPAAAPADGGAQPNPETAKAAGDIAEAAKKFLATLDEAQRGKLVYDFKDDAQRKNWSNFPISMVKRGGLRVGDLTASQRDAAMAVVTAALSPQGYEKVMQIVEGDEALKKPTAADAGAAPADRAVLHRAGAADAAERPCSGATSISFPSSGSPPPPSRG